MKTSLFFLMALLFLLLACFLSRPQTETVQPNQMLNQILFPDLKDVLDVGSLRIQKVQSSGIYKSLEVKKAEGQWLLSSFNGYPANAQNRMVEVTASLSGLEVLRVVGSDREVQTRCGVLTRKEAPQAKPVELGTLVTIRSTHDKILLDLILGHEVKKGSGQYYVRHAGENPVYVVQMDPSLLTVNFADWIETDLLKIEPFDIEVLSAKDNKYQSIFVVKHQYGETPEWLLHSNMKLTGLDGQGLQNFGLPAGKVLSEEKLHQVSHALSDMRISSVLKKPGQLGKAFLHPENICVEEEENQQLIRFGFGVYTQTSPGGEVMRLVDSTDDQLQVCTNNGLVFKLYFGGIAGQEVVEDFLEVKDQKFYRFLLITAELFPDGLKKPELQELPPKPADDADPAAKAQYQALLEMNQQEQKIYEEKLEQAQKKVEKLNALFADWFYIIPEDVYQQIHLTHKNIFISEEEAKKNQEEMTETEHEHAHEHEHELN